MTPLFGPTNSGGWSLYFNPAGTALFFSGKSGGQQIDYLSTNIQWHSNDWHLVTLTYCATQTALYIDAQLAAQGAGLSISNSYHVAFSIGSDAQGTNVAHGQFDEVCTFDLRLDAAWVAGYFNYLHPTVLLGPETNAPSGGGQGGVPTVPGGGSGGSSGGGGQIQPASSGGNYHTNLWLEIALTNNNALLTVHGTSPGSNYVILSATNLLSSGINLSGSNWVAEAYLFGVDATHVSQVLIPLTGRPMLFFRLGSGEDSDGDGLPDAYESLVTHTDPNNPDTGNTDVSDAYKHYDGDGLTNLDEMRNGTNPNEFSAPPAPQPFSAFLNPSGSSATLAWNPSPGPVLYYLIERADPQSIFGGLGDFHQIEEIDATETSFEDTGTPVVQDPWGGFYGPSFNVYNSV